MVLELPGFLISGEKPDKSGAVLVLP